MLVRTLFLSVLFVLPVCHAQEKEPADESTTETVEAEVKVANKVEVAPINSDEEIEARLSSIFEATSWFEGIDVRVDGGVAFLTGLSDTETHRDWAEQTAMNTSDVVAVVNRLSVAEKPIWNFAPAVASLKELARDTTSLLPLIAIAIVLVIVFYFLSIAGAKLTRWLVRDRLHSGLLRQVSGNVMGVLIFIIGFYIALRVSGLTRLAVTLLGGTGLIGLALGFAFRDIAENYLASILISLNNPFRVGDLVEIEGQKGYVRKVTTRGTVLNSEDGNQIQIPNSSVYKDDSELYGDTADPSRVLGRYRTRCPSRSSAEDHDGRVDCTHSRNR
jgi:small conductance mechanosensitive channel